MYFVSLLTYRSLDCFRERLSATEMLTIRKVMEHVYDRIVRPAEQSEGTNGTTSSLYAAQYPPSLEQKVEIYCNNQVLFHCCFLELYFCTLIFLET